MDPAGSRHISIDPARTGDARMGPGRGCDSGMELTGSCC